MRALDWLADALTDQGWETRRLDNTMPRLRVWAADTPTVGETIMIRLGPDERPWFYSSAGAPLAPTVDIPAACRKITGLLAPLTATPGAGKLHLALRLRCLRPPAWHILPDMPPTAPDGPLWALRAVLRRRAPHIATNSVEHTEPEPAAYLTVSYADSGDRRIVWVPGMAAYRWDTGPDAGTVIRAHAGRVAEHVAWTLGAPIRPGP